MESWVVSEICVGTKQRAVGFHCCPSYRQRMASNRTELTALKRLIAEADHVLATTPPLPENRSARLKALFMFII